MARHSEFFSTHKQLSAWACAALCTAVAALAIGAATPVQAAEGTSSEPVEFSYLTGEPAAALAISGKPLPVGTILAMRIRPTHPLKLNQLEIAYWGKANAPIELHVWRDNGGSQPGAPGGYFTDDPQAELLPAIAAKTAANGVWTTVDLASSAVELPALEQFWVGVKITSADTNVGVDKISKDQTVFNAMVQTPGEPCGDGCGVPGNLAMRVHGTYINKMTNFWLTDVTKAAGIAAGGRMAFGDFDNDGDDDLLYGGAILYRNDGKGHFEDISAKAGLTGLGGSGALWGDFDNDGHLDIWVFGAAEHLLHNNGNATFAEVSPGLFFDSDQYPTEGSVLLDLDNDGRLDIYNANYEWYHKDDKGVEILSDCGHDFVWHNDGNGKWTEIGTALGVRSSGKQCGRGPAAIDWDQDGDTDIFVNNYRLTPEFFWRNDYPAQKLVNIAAALGVKGSGAKGAFGHGTGAQWVDADNDGDFDLFAANLAHPRFIKFSDTSRFYRNDGTGPARTLTDFREATGIGYAETQSAPSFADIDNDGDQDLAVGAYYGDRMGQFWRNDGATANPAMWLHFSDATYPAGFTPMGCASLAWADIDGDGDVDCAANATLYRNDYSDVVGVKGHWLTVKLAGSKVVNRAAIGAWVTLETGDGQMQSRLVSGGQGLATQDSARLHFGLGAATQVSKVTVHWPGLPAEQFGPFAADQRVEIVEGQGVTSKPAATVDAGSTADAATADGQVGDAGGADTAAKTSAPAPADGCSARPVGTNSAAGAAWALATLAAAGVAARRRRAIAVNGRQAAAGRRTIAPDSTVGSV